jgi:hypothetical protein
MNIGFDLDNVFISLPPLVPSKIIDFFYKGKINHELKYRIPSKIEQIVRIISHYPILRPPIYKNLEYLRNLTKTKKDKYYLISSRFSFLKKRTENLIKRHELNKIFTVMHFNYSNKQPHEFKNEMIKKTNLNIFVDDDLELLEYLVKKNPKTKFFWLNKKISKTLEKNLFAIRNISEIFN